MASGRRELGGGPGDGRRAVAAFFDDHAAARQAVDDLAAAGVTGDRITLVAGDASLHPAGPVPMSDKGLWDTLKDLFMADEDRHAYGEGLRRGGFLLSVMVAGDDARIVEILDREGAVDMDARQSDWELEGWDPVRAAADLDTLASPRTTARTTTASTLAAAEVRAAIEPAAAIGPAIAAGRTKGASPSAGRKVVRDVEAEGLRLRTYAESQDPPNGSR